VSAPIQFQPTCDVTQGGVLLALPALLAVGLLRYTPEMYQLTAGFYGIDSIFVLLALMALARISLWNSCAIKLRGNGANSWVWTESPKCAPCGRS
jgi:hypothetical protein